jgi:xylulokinase
MARQSTMQRMSRFLGLDVGTQGVKALLWDSASGAVLARAAAPLGLLPTARPGAAEQHPRDWLAAIEAALAQLPRRDLARVAGVGVSGQQHCCVVLDERDEVIRPAKLWCDVECAAEAAQISAQTGRAVPAGFTAPKLPWLRRHEPQHFARIRSVLLPHDFVNLWLTGRKATDHGDASGTGYYDPARRAWDVPRGADWLDAAWLPPLLAAGEICGALRAEIAERTGLPAGIPVAAGSGDNMMSALGAGAVREGTLVCSLGTSGTLFGPAAACPRDPAGLVAPFCDATGQWLPLWCTMNCTTPAEEVRQAFCMEHAALTALAAREPSGAGGLQFLPYLTGERAPDWPHARGVLHGLTPGALRPGPLYRAALEGAAFALRRGLDHLPFVASELRVVGGGARNPLWRRILADLFAVPLVFPREAETAALGAALQAAAAASGAEVADFVAAHPPELAPERVQPHADAALHEAFARHRELGARLFGRA